ncbi:hypothetical protein FBU59_006470, partial [Linderina macrospora]
PSHIQSARIAKSYRDIAKWLIRHEFFFYFTEDLKLEEQFEERLGIEDRGYWVFARNYRNFLKDRIQNFAHQNNTFDNPELNQMVRDGMPEYHKLEQYVDNQDHESKLK